MPEDLVYWLVFGLWGQGEDEGAVEAAEVEADEVAETLLEHAEESAREVAAFPQGADEGALAVSGVGVEVAAEGVAGTDAQSQQGTLFCRNEGAAMPCFMTLLKSAVSFLSFLFLCLKEGAAPRPCQCSFWATFIISGMLMPMCPCTYRERACLRGDSAWRDHVGRSLVETYQTTWLQCKRIVELQLTLCESR